MKSKLIAKAVFVALALTVPAGAFAVEAAAPSNCAAAQADVLPQPGDASATVTTPVSSGTATSAQGTIKKP
jgi:hypothetical protein